MVDGSNYPPPQPQDRALGMPSPAPVPTCYRHDDRPTRLACSSCGRPICVDCTRQAAVGQKCPECAAPTGRSRVVNAAQIRGRSGLDGAPVVRAILYVTAAIGVLGFLAPAAWQPVAEPLAHGVAAVEDGQVWRMVSAALVHDPRSFFHVLFNMWALFVFGPDLERRFGSVPFLLFYTASAAAGGLAFQLTNDGGTAIGASGAIFGLFGAYVTSAFLSRHTPAGRAGLNQLLPLLLLNLALPLIIPRIAWEAHLGGLVAGAVMIAAWRAVATQAGTGPDADGQRTVRSLIAGAVLVASLLVALVA
ncbi:rhomboid family intramembrane serine protease [Euzebya sp.]|uniref:rhomboid family intramembrane serine protease n=1 Tax=Euzebya sp. TaxID=1971409 RepID=UPI0035115C88